MGNLGLTASTDWHSIQEIVVFYSNKRFGFVEYRKSPTKTVVLLRTARNTREWRRVCTRISSPCQFTGPLATWACLKGLHVPSGRNPGLQQKLKFQHWGSLASLRLKDLGINNPEIGLWLNWLWLWSKESSKILVLTSWYVSCIQETSRIKIRGRICTSRPSRTQEHWKFFRFGTEHP